MTVEPRSAVASDGIPVRHWDRIIPLKTGVKTARLLGVPHRFGAGAGTSAVLGGRCRALDVAVLLGDNMSRKGVWGADKIGMPPLKKVSLSDSFLEPQPLEHGVVAGLILDIFEGEVTLGAECVGRVFIDGLFEVIERSRLIAGVCKQPREFITRHE